MRINDLFKDMKTEIEATIGDAPRMARLAANLIRNRDANEAKAASGPIGHGHRSDEREDGRAAAGQGQPRLSALDEDRE
jgi:hypothetical protein